MTQQHAATERGDAQLRAWMDAEAEAPASTRLFEQVFASTRTMPQVRRWPAWWPFSPDRAGGTGGTWTRRLLLLAAVALVALGAAMLAGGGQPFRSFDRPVPSLESRAVTVFAQTCAHPRSIAVVGSDVWVTCLDQVRWFDRSGAVEGALSGTALGVDAAGGWLATGDRVASLDRAGTLGPLLPAPNISDVALDDGSAWAMDATDHRVVRVDRTTNTLMATIALPSRPSTIVASGGKAWVLLPDIERIAVVDPASNSVTDLVVVAHPAAILAAFDAIWVVSDAPLALTRIDPATLRTDRHPIQALGSSRPDIATRRMSVADVGGSLWIAADAEVAELDPTTVAALRVISVLATDPIPIGGIAGLDGQLLLIGPDQDRILAISP